MLMTTSSEGRALISHFEGFYPKPYLCPAGVPTIGYGTTVYPGGRKVSLKDQPTTEEQAREYLSYDLIEAALDVMYLVHVHLTQCQFDALVSFQYNTGALGKSTLLRLLNAGDYLGAAEEFLKWDKAADPKTKLKVALPGLTRRRKAERKMFLGEPWKE